MAHGTSGLRSIHDFRHQTHHYALDRDDHISKANKALNEIMTPSRISRAALFTCQRQVEELQAGLAKLRKENEKSALVQRDFSPCSLTDKVERDRLRALRESLASRRRMISAAKLQTTPPIPPSREAEILSNLSIAIARARSGLVQELVEIFNIVEVGGRPPIGGKAGTKGEWTIGDLILPVPGDMRRKC